MEILKACCEALEDKKAADVTLLFLGEKSSITDYFLIATGNSEPHLKALWISVQKKLKELKVHMIGSQAEPQSGWIVIDAFDFMVHLFLPEQRDMYRLEALWKDAETLEVARLPQA